MAAAVSLETPSPLGDSHSGGDGGGCAVPPPATPGPPSAALASPKRVSFAAPPPRLKPAGSGNASQAVAALRRLRVELADAEFQGSPLVAAAADHALTFLPEVDSPRGLRLTRRGPRPRLPCNEASLCALGQPCKGCGASACWQPHPLCRPSSLFSHL